MKKFLLILSSLFVLYACTNQEKDELEEDASPSENTVKIPTEQDGTDSKNGVNTENTEIEEEISQEIDFKRYFKPANSTSTFIGDGNEYASYNEKTSFLAENYVATIVDNGGAVMLKVYRVLEDRIDLIMEELVNGTPEDGVYPEIETLDALSALETYLAGPIEVGTAFGSWTIVKVDIELATPYQTFEHVFVIEQSGDGFTNRKYFAENYGVIKTESIMSANSTEEVMVTSTLEDISLH